MYATVFRDPEGDSLCRISRTTKCIVNHSLLVCPDDAVAILSINGESKLYKPGRWPITTGEFPFFVTLRNAFRHGDAGFDARCFYLPQPSFIHHMSMGTGEVIVQEARFDQTVRLLGAFDLDISVADPMVFFKSLIGGFAGSFSSESDLKPRLDALILPKLTAVMSERLSGIQVSEIHHHLRDISAAVLRSASAPLREIGLMLRDVSVKALTLNDEDRKRVASLEEARAKAGVELSNEKDRLQAIYGGSLNERRKDAIVGLGSPNSAPGSAGNSAASLGAMVLQLDYLRRAFPNGLEPNTSQADDRLASPEAEHRPPPQRHDGSLPPPRREG